MLFVESSGTRSGTVGGGAVSSMVGAAIEPSSTRRLEGATSCSSSVLMAK